MYAIGEYLVHPGQGVCRVEGVTEGPQAVYQLLPIGKRHPIYISFPIANEGRLRPVLSRAEAEQIIDDYPSIQVEQYQARNNSLEEEHEEISARNKKPPVAYERILKEARERSSAEIAVALGCTPEDVFAIFEQRMEINPEEN